MNLHFDQGCLGKCGSKIGAFVKKIFELHKYPTAKILTYDFIFNERMNGISR